MYVVRRKSCGAWQEACRKSHLSCQNFMISIVLLLMQVGKTDYCVSEGPDQAVETYNLFLLLAYNQEEPTGSRQFKCIGKVVLNL